MMQKSSIVKNFQFFALAYLNDWWQYDSKFVCGLSRSKDSCGVSPSNDSRRECLVEAAAYYNVVRSFSKKAEDPSSPRMAKALEILDIVCIGGITEKNVDAHVNELAQKFRSAYPAPPRKGAQQLTGDHEAENSLQTAKQTPGFISAASKFLWLLRKSPVVIYDQRACYYLNSLARTKCSTENYAAYRSEWNSKFKDYQFQIQCACEKLKTLENFAPDNEVKERLKSTVEAQWFRERVFDKFLWWNGRPVVQPSSTASE